MMDTLNLAERSTRMSLVRSTGNKSTELRVERGLVELGVDGWVKHPASVHGRPDFYFPEIRLAVFVHGCFWHGCPKCARRTPRTRHAFWKDKISANVQRDGRTRRRLWRSGYHVMTIWEHALRDERWIRRLVKLRADKTGHLATRAAESRQPYSPGVGKSTSKFSRK